MKIPQYSWWHHVRTDRDFVVWMKDPIKKTIWLLQKYQDELKEMDEDEFVKRVNAQHFKQIDQYGNKI